MTMRMLLLPLGALAVLAAVVGFRAGQPMADSDIISFFAQKYVAEHSGALTDCVATPSDQDGVRISVICTNNAGGGLVYEVGRRGELINTNLIREPQA